MIKNRFNLLNMISFYIYWYLCILGPSKGSYYLGPIFAILYFTIHFIYTQNKINDFKLFFICGILGLAVESIFDYSGFITYKGILMDKFNVIPLWVIILWFGFGLTLLHSFKWILGQYSLSLLLGGFFAPFFYISAHKLSSIIINYNLFYSYIVLAILWSLIFLFINIIATTIHASN